MGNKEDVCQGKKNMQWSSRNNPINGPNVSNCHEHEEIDRRSTQRKGHIALQTSIISV